MKVALVVLDTLRKDAFDEHFEWLSGIRFEHAWSTSHWTMPAHASLFTGKYPSEAGTHAKSEGLHDPDPTLPELLQQAGFTTRAFSANLMVSPPFRFDRGFVTFDGSWRLNVNSRELIGWTDLSRDTQPGFRGYLEVLRRILSREYRVLPSLQRGIQNRLAEVGIESGAIDDGATTCLQTLSNARFSDDEFLFINLMEAHAPYRPPENYRTVDEASYDEVAATVGDLDVDSAAARAAYDDSVRYLADMYKRIFTILSEQFDYIVTIGDHGELFGEHQSWRHFHGIYPELTHIPMVVSGDGLNSTSNKPASILDVHRTILDLAGIEAPSRGQNLLEGLDGRPRLTEFQGLRPGRIEMMRERGYSEELIARFDRPLAGLASESYYGYETTDEWQEDGSSPMISPRESLETLQAELNRSQQRTDSPDLSQKLQNRLRDLGYA